MAGKSIFLAIIIIFILVFIAVDKFTLFAEENELQVLCNQLESFKRYESKKIGYEETKSYSWEIGEKIVAYRQEAIPYLLDIYKNSDNLIAQLFAARLISEIDYDRGVKLLENFKDNELTIETIFDSSMTSMTIADVARKELAILEVQQKKIESTQNHIKSKI